MLNTPQGEIYLLRIYFTVCFPHLCIFVIVFSLVRGHNYKSSLQLMQAEMFKKF